MNYKFEETIQKAMKEMKISRKKAIGELTVFMCSNGTIEDFREFINYLTSEERR